MHKSIQRQNNTFRTSVKEKNSLDANTYVIFSSFFVAWSVWQDLLVFAQGGLGRSL